MSTVKPIPPAITRNSYGCNRTPTGPPGPTNPISTLPNTPMTPRITPMRDASYKLTVWIGKLIGFLYEIIANAVRVADPKRLLTIVLL
jgi:hypothetical protein